MSFATYRSVDVPPTPPSRGDASRWSHTRLRRRMLDGAWAEDLRSRVRSRVGGVRSEAWGAVDLSSNPYRVISRELATLYVNAPSVRHDQGDDAIAALTSAVNASGLWPAMNRYQAWVIGCREYLLRAHCTASGELRYRPVPPDLVCAYESDDLPDVPAALHELRLRKHPTKRDEWVWAWDCFDIRDPSHPVYRVVEAGRDGGATGDDLSEHFLTVRGHSREPGENGESEGEYVDLPAPRGGLVDDAYPYTKADGTPVIPYVTHHAERLGDRLWDAFEGMELVEGSLNLGVLHSFWLHLTQDTSWPQRYTVNARPAGLTSVGADGQEQRLEIVSDPATLLVLEQIDREPGSIVLVSQWEPGGDPDKLLSSIESYAARLAQDAGVSGSDLMRSSGDPRSGYAISLSNEGKRAAQRRFAPHFRWSDQQLMALSAVLHNRATGGTLPEDGYAVAYQQIPLSPEELRARRDHVLALMAAGLASPIDAYLELNPGLTRTQAREDIERIAQERRELTALMAPQPADPNASTNSGGAQTPMTPPAPGSTAP